MHSKSKLLLTLVLTLCVAATGCSAQWINVALQDLPVLTQMALNIATLVSVLSTTTQAKAADQAVIQNISAQASRDLNFLQTLYAEYKANPNTTTLGKIQSVIAGLNQNLPASLESAHISNATLAARVTAAVNLILTTVNNFAALMPRTSTAAARTVGTPVPASLPTSKELKKSWNQQICAATGNVEFDRVLADCTIR